MQKIKDRKFLYFGSPNGDIKQIWNGKFLTCYKSIASCFSIDLNEVYGEYNKKYTSINWGYDQWSKSFSYLQKNEIPQFVKITNNAKDWIATSGESIGYIYSIELNDYILNHLQKFEDSDQRLEVVYNGKKKIAIYSVEKINVDWSCQYSKIKSNYCGFATIGAEKYQKPYNIEILKEKHPKLLDDPVHKWRAKNGIELIHKEPDFQEQKRIFYNWIIMPKPLQEKSDIKSKRLFGGMNNLEHHNAIMEYEWHDENYFELADIRQRYNKKDMQLNGFQYVHISLSDKPITFIPRIPKNTFDLKGAWKQYSENDTIPRICCSNSIFGAISAIKINVDKTYYVHLLQPQKVISNQQVCQYVPDALATGECWILDDEIKSSVVGKLKIGSPLPYVCTFLKDQNKFFRCVRYHDYELELI